MLNRAKNRLEILEDFTTDRQLPKYQRKFITARDSDEDLKMMAEVMQCWEQKELNTIHCMAD